MSIWQILAIVVAAVEVIGGLLIAFNVLDPDRRGRPAHLQPR